VGVEDITEALWGHAREPRNRCPSGPSDAQQARRSVVEGAPSCARRGANASSARRRPDAPGPTSTPAFSDSFLSQRWFIGAWAPLQ
jgi:hypothetical protein